MSQVSNAIQSQHRTKPSYNLQALKSQVGITPFTQRLKLVDNYCRCPFHQGDGEKSFHVVEKEGGIFIGTCFSVCGKSFDAIEFVKASDKISTGDAIRKLSALISEGGAVPTAILETPKEVEPMTAKEWETRGRPVTDADVALLATSRQGSATPAAFTLNEMGFKVAHLKGHPFLAVPHRLGETFYNIKVRDIMEKKFLQERSVSQKSLFNIDAVRKGCDVFVVESELDAAVLYEHGYIAVSVVNAKQKMLEPEVLHQLTLAKRIFLVGDQDAPGQLCMDNLQKLLPADKVYRINFPESDKDPAPKDVGEWARNAERDASVLGRFETQWEALKTEAYSSWIKKTVPNLSDVSAKPVEWVIDRLLPVGGLLVLAGAYGSMKSLLAMYLAGAIATGKPVFGRAVSNRPRPVLFLDRENPQPVIGERRTGIGIPADAPIHYWGEWLAGDDFKNGVPNLADPRLDEFAIREKGVIVIDSLIDFLDGAEENSSSEMTKIMQRITRLARIGGGVIVLHHATKDATNLRGSTAIPAAADIAVIVSKIETKKAKGQPTPVQLKTEKTRMCGAWGMKIFCHFGASWGWQVQNDDIEVEQRNTERLENAETCRVHNILRKVLGEYHSQNDNAGMPRTALVNKVKIDADISRKKAEEHIQTGIGQKWSVEIGQRGVILHRLTGGDDVTAKHQSDISFDQ